MLRSAKDSKTTCRADLYSRVVSMNSVAFLVRWSDRASKTRVRTRIFVVPTTDLDSVYQAPRSDLADVLQSTILLQLACIPSVIGCVELHTYDEILWHYTGHTNRLSDLSEESEGVPIRRILVCPAVGLSMSLESIQKAILRHTPSAK